MKGLLQGLVAGLLAGAVLAALSFVDYGSGNSLAGVANWLGLGGVKWIGFLALLVFGGLFGALFGAVENQLQGRTQITPGRLLVGGLVTGLVLWVVLRLLSGTLIHQQRLDFAGFLYSFVPSLVYGLLLGAIAFQRASMRKA